MIRFTIMKNIERTLWSVCALLLMLLVLTGCGSTKNVTYLLGAEQLSSSQLSKEPLPYAARVKPYDLLRIVVSGAEDAETYFPFNIMISPPSNDSNVQSMSVLQSYLVDSKGQIDFPVLGKLQVSNLTTNQLSVVIADKLRSYLKGDLVVTVRFASYKISVLGEVNDPGAYSVKDEKINILQVLSMAGDLTLYGRRDVVKVIREYSNGQKSITTLNLNDRNLIFSPYYYLQPGDVVYVEPNKAKAKSASIGSATNLTFSVVSVLIGVASLIVTITR